MHQHIISTIHIVSFTRIKRICLHVLLWCQVTVILTWPWYKTFYLDIPRDALLFCSTRMTANQSLLTPQKWRPLPSTSAMLWDSKTFRAGWRRRRARCSSLPEGTSSQRSSSFGITASPEKNKDQENQTMPGWRWTW